MTARLILARHGNTFRPEDKPVWVGARSDLPLVEKGIAQAENIAEALLRTKIKPDAIIAGPLKRTMETAKLIAGRLNIDAKTIRIDGRLREIDYGIWEGLATEEIIAAGGGAELAAWNKQSIFPSSPDWQPDEAKLTVDSCAIMAEATTGTTLVVTSNGILRFFARAAANAADFPDRKVATGHICVMERAGAAWRIASWSQPPHSLEGF